MNNFIIQLIITLRNLVVLTFLLTLITCSPNEKPTHIEKESDNVEVELPKRVARDLIVEGTTDIGIPVCHATFHVKKSEEYLTLEPKHVSFPSAAVAPMSIMLENLTGELFQFPLTIGHTWQERDYRNVNSIVTLEKYEPVETPLGTFQKCLKHKTVFTNAKKRSHIGKALTNGTRYIWFAEGIGIVKMRYEHSNGIVTEAELIDYIIEDESKDYLPTTQGTTWTYKWKNDYYNETYIEKIKVSDGHNPSIHGNVVCTLLANVKTVDGNDESSGQFYIERTDRYLTLRGSTLRLNDSTIGLSSGSGIPYSLSPLLRNISRGIPEKGLLLFPLTKGKTWNQSNQHYWKVQEEITIEDYESVQVDAGTFPQTLKHKTVLFGADTSSFFKEKEERSLNNSLINGTRYIWFANGIGIVKMRYEHSNGIITEAELIDYNIPQKNEDYFPLNLGTSWTYKWKNDYLKKPIIEKIQVVRAGDGNETPIKEVKYSVEIDAEKPDVAKVTCQFLPQEHHNTNRIRLALNADDTYIQDISLRDSSYYTTIPSDRKVWEFELKDSYTLPLTLRYNASIEHGTKRNKTSFEYSGIQKDPTYLPYEREDCVSWSSKFLFIVGRDCNNISVEFKLPKRWHVSTPWQRVGRRGYKYTVKNPKELTEPYLLIGKHAELIAKSGETEVMLAIGDSLIESKDELQDVVQELISVYNDFFNGEPTNPMLFIFNPYNQKLGNPMKGVGQGQSISILMDRVLSDARRHKWGPFLAHEVFHIWNGQTALANFSRKEHWFKEGVSDYYADITAVRLGYLTEREYLNRLEYACEAYLSASTKQKITNSQDRRLLYNGGNLITAALDCEIRQLTENRKSFDDVLKQMYDKFYNSSERYTLTDIIKIVNNVGGKDFEPFFSMYVDGKEKLPLSEYLGKAGFDVVIKNSVELPTTAYVSQVIRESLGLEARVMVSAVNGVGIAKLKELSKIAKEWRSGDTIELTYTETGEEDYVTNSVTLSGLSDKPPMTPEIVVQITENTGLTKLQRDILTDIFSRNKK